MSNLYPLIVYLRLSLNDYGYVRQSPIRKLSIIPHHAFRSNKESVIEFFSLDDELSKHCVEYIKEIYEEGKLRGYLLYRYYRLSNGCYGLTFIRNQSPLILQITNVAFPLICSV